MNTTSLDDSNAQGQCCLWTLEQLAHPTDWGQRPWHGARALGAGCWLPPQRWAHTLTVLSRAEGRHCLGWAPRPMWWGKHPTPTRSQGPLNSHPCSYKHRLGQKCRLAAD